MNRLPCLAAAIVLLGVSHLAAAPPQILQLRTQKVEQTTYFHVRFATPPDMLLPRIEQQRWWEITPVQWARLPVLVPSNASTQAVYLRLDFTDSGRNGPFPAKEQPAAAVIGRLVWGTPSVDNLEFFGKVGGAGSAKLILLYPTKVEPPTKQDKTAPILQLLQQRGSWAEEEITLDFAQAKKLVPPEGGYKRNGQNFPDPDDLEGQWASAQAARFALLEVQAPECGFYSFARDTTSRRYQVPAPHVQGGGSRPRHDFETRRLYEVTTGANAITESLALHRLRNANFRGTEQRTIDIANVRGVDIAEHPWVKMMAGKKPSPEPLAQLVPQDNYYLHFKDIRKFIEAGELLDQWGTTILRAFEVHSRDYHLKERLEQQLCLKSGPLARLFGPAVVKSMALTGSDPYIREGSDLTVLFHITSKTLFTAAVEPYLKEARAKFATELKESKEDFDGIAVESFVTPLREVSLHRAFFGDYVACSNSPVGLRRILDCYKGKAKPLADSLDYQYMRTIFRLEDKAEDGFVFLSDPFIRGLVGPAVRIKERRRLEALTSLAMVTHGAMFAGWERGKLPPHQNQLLAATGLKPAELFTPDGPNAYWDGERQLARSETYNSLHFATPLIELPIDKVTPSEQREYDDFRRQYMGLWREFFDPIGMRLSFANQQVRWETYILPLVRTTQYNELRNLTGDGTITLDPAMFGKKTLVQWVAHISPNSRERQQASQFLTGMVKGVPGLNWLGDWITIRLDDSDIYSKLLERTIRQELSDKRDFDFEEQTRLFFQIPLTVGIEIRNPLVFAGVLTGMKASINNTVPNALDWEALPDPYKGTTIVRIRSRPGSLIDQTVNRNTPEKDRFQPALYYVLLGNAFYLSLQEAPLKDLIDRHEERQKAKADGKTTPGSPVNTALYISPVAATKSKEMVRAYLEWETHQRALVNSQFLYALYRTGVISPADTAETVEAAAMKFLGFVPVSPDLAPFVFDAKQDEVSNRRHGSPRRPRLQPGIETTSPLGDLLEQFRHIRADLRFREDGIHTTLTLQRGAKKGKAGTP